MISHKYTWLAVPILYLFVVNGNDISLFNTEMIFKKYEKSSGYRNSMQSDIPGGSVVKNLPANKGDMGLIPE